MAQKHLLFVTSCRPGEEGAITAFRLDADKGSLTQTQQYTEVENPFFLALSPDRKHLYSTHVPGNFNSDNGYVVAFELIDGEGTLRRINQQSAEGVTICYVDIDPSGKAVVAANYTSGSVLSYPVGDDGSLEPRVSFYGHQGASLVDVGRQEKAHAHCAIISPNGRQMFACDLGTDQVMGYALDAETAGLTPLAQPYVRTIGGGGPRHFTFHPQGVYAYANNELANSVNVYGYDGDTGRLTELQVIPSLPEGFDGESYTADLKVTPDGRFLYCTNRGHDSIAVYAIGADGCLSLVDIQASGGNFPQNLAITPDGGLLLCANMQAAGDDKAGENVAVFRIDAESGRLEAAAAPTPLAGPSCIMIV
jgi:6-phosphogluconolactonase